MKHNSNNYMKSIPNAHKKSGGNRVCDELIYNLIYKTGSVRGGVTQDAVRVAGANKIATIGRMFQRGFRQAFVKKLLIQTMTEIRDQIVCREGQPREDVELDFFEYDIKCQLERSLKTIRSQGVHAPSFRRVPAIRVSPIRRAPRRREHRAVRSTPTSTTAGSGESPGPSDPDPAPSCDGNDPPQLAACIQGIIRLLRVARGRSPFRHFHQGNFHQGTGGRS